MASSVKPCCSNQSRGAPVQQGHEVGLLGEQAGAQHVAEQLVVAEPLPPVVEGDEEEVVALEGAQHRGGVTTVERRRRTTAR